MNYSEAVIHHADCSTVPERREGTPRADLLTD